VEGGRLATEHLLAGGRRQIAFLGDTTLPEVSQRYDGYCKALATYGLKPSPALSVPATFVADSARRAVQDLIARKVDFDAIVACSDVLAMNAISALRNFNLNVPDDVAVVGYDDVQMAAHCDPPLTTIRQPIDSGGRALVDALFAVMETGRANTTVLRTELVARGTSPVVRPVRRQVRTGT
jgi:DNA-binding LacI/PurR family transcriptional regulator